MTRGCVRGNLEVCLRLCEIVFKYIGMEGAFIICSVVVLLVGSAVGEGCANPKVTAISYTTQDATVLTNIAYVADFTVDCSGSKGQVGSLYVEIQGRTLPAARVGNTGRYVVSWTQEIKKASTGDHQLSVYDEDGYAGLRKAIRNGEDPTKIKPFVTVILNHPGTYQGPWVNSEFMAALLAGVVSYLAYAAKSKLLQ